MAKISTRVVPGGVWTPIKIESQTIWVHQDTEYNIDVSLSLTSPEDKDVEIQHRNLFEKGN